MGRRGEVEEAVGHQAVEGNIIRMFLSPHTDTERQSRCVICELFRNGVTRSVFPAKLRGKGGTVLSRRRHSPQPASCRCILACCISDVTRVSLFCGRPDIDAEDALWIRLSA